MFSKLGAFFKVLRVGNEVADPDKWMKRQADGNKVGLLVLALLGLARVYGYEIPMSDEDALILGGAVVSIWNIMFGALTSYRQGLLPAAKQPVDGGPAASSPAPEAVRVETPAPTAVQPTVQTTRKTPENDGFDDSIYRG